MLLLWTIGLTCIWWGLASDSREIILLATGAILFSYAVIIGLYIEHGAW